MNNNYWDVRYSKGGNSGDGSIGLLRDFKWKKIKERVGVVDDVIDVGCGDLSFWDGKDCEKYVGIDSSEVIIQKNILKRPRWNFVVSRSDNFMISTLYNANVVFCFDMLFHIIDDSVYNNTIENLSRFSNKYIFIYTWIRNPFTGFDGLKNKNVGFAIRSLACGMDTDFKYQKYRDFNKSVEKLSDFGFELVGIDSDKIIDKYGALYFFSK